MGIARPPANSPKKYIQSTEGTNIDQWASVNINKFVPEALQPILDAINEILDTVANVIALGLAAAKLLAALVSELFDLLTAILEAIRETILALLDLFPKLDTGIHLLWIPNQRGGVDYYTNTFKSSLTDQRDPRKPAQDTDFYINSLFFMWGFPDYSNVIGDASKISASAGKIADAFKRLFGLNNLVEERYEVPTPNDFTVEKGYFVKAKDSTQPVTNIIKVPSSNLESLDDADAFFSASLRATVQKISRKSDVSGVSHHIRWRIPEEFGAFSRKNTKYLRSVDVISDGTELYSYTKRVTKLIGIDIVRGETLKDTEYAKEALRTDTSNIYSVNSTADEYEDEVPQAFESDTVIIHHSLSSVPGTDYYVDFAPEAESKNYYYSAAFVYTQTVSQIFVTVKVDKTIEVTEVKQLDFENQKKINLPNIEDYGFLNHSDFNFADVDPADIAYADIDLDKSITFVATPTQVVAAPASKIRAPGGGAPPDWFGFRLLEDMFPEIQEFLDKARNLVNTIIDSVLDDADALQRWIETKLSELEDLLNEADELVKLLQNLLFPPLAGVHLLDISTRGGMPAVVRRYEESLKLGLQTEKGAYNPLLLDQGFRQENPKEFAKRVDIPAYDENHIVGGFVMVFQSPAVKAFISDLFALDNSFNDNFQQILNDSRLRLNKFVIPELKHRINPTHPFVEVLDYDNPDDFMNKRSNHKIGAGNGEGEGDASNEDTPVNSDGNVEIKSKAGPFFNGGAPISMSVLCDDEFGVPVYHSVIIPRGNVTAEQIVNLIPCGAATVDDGSFVIEGKNIGISPCSGEAAELFGIEPGLQLSAPDTNPLLEGEPFEVVDGDQIVVFANNGRPTLEMRKAEPPIFQLRAVDDSLLTPTSYNIKINVEGEEHIIDVTGNAGANAIDQSPTWFFEATFPLKIVEPDIPEAIVGNDQFKFQISGAPVVANGVDDSEIVLTLRPLTYRNINELSAEILRLLIDAGYPIGLFVTTPNTLGTNTVFSIAEDWAKTADVVLTITPETRDFIADLDTSVVSPGTDNLPYLVDDLVANLNAPFSLPYFSNENDRIRITGVTVGPSSTIKVFTSNANAEYALVSKALFGFNEIQTDDTIVAGLGTAMLSNEYWIDIQVQQFCIEISQDGEIAPVLEIELQKDELLVEVVNAVEQEYTIEFVG